MNSGYSKTPLERKLGIKEGFHCQFYEPTPAYTNWIQSLDLSLELNASTKLHTLDFAHAFCKTYNDLEAAILILKPLLKYTGMLWISWPKGSSKIPTVLKREPIRDYVLDNGLVDVKVAAIDEDWSGLKFVYRLKDRP